MKKNKVLPIILFLVLELILFFVEKRFFHQSFSFDRVIIFTFVNLFFCAHFLFYVNDLYDFLYKKRYFICVILLVFITIMGYSGSSISFWNSFIQPNHYIASGTNVLGTSRGIRGDEYNVSTPTIFSQKFNNFNYSSDRLSAREEPVVLFPTLPSKHISIFGKLWNIPYLFLPLENAFSFSWFFPVFLIFLSSFELCMLVCDKKKLYALTGAFLITFSAASCWWSNMTILGIGATAVVLFNLFLSASKFFVRLIYAILIGIVGANYIMLMYPAWMVPFGYVYLAFVIWLLHVHKDKLNLKMLFYIPIVLLIMLIIVVPAFIDSAEVYSMIMSSVYPGARVSVGGGNLERLFCYYINIFFPIKAFFNPCEYGNFLSLFPLPIIVSIFYFIKYFYKKKKVDFLVGVLTVFSILLVIWNFIKLPEIISRVSLLSFSTDGRSQLAVGYMCIFIVLRIITKCVNKKKITFNKFVLCVLVSIIFNVFGILFINSYFDEYFTKKMIFCDLLIFVPIVSLFLLNNKKTNNYLMYFLIIISFVNGGLVNPITKGIGVFYEKPVSKEIKKILKNDYEANWIVANSNYAIPNFLIANGAKVINSTNYYPNVELWKKFDLELKDEYIYNRYAHVRIDIINDDSYFELLFEDSFVLHLNVIDFDKLNVNYIFSTEDISDKLLEVAECVYNEDGVYIYKVVK